MRGVELLGWLASLAPDARDAAIEKHLGIVAPATSHASPGEHLVGYHASGIAPILRALVEAAVRADDVVVDLGSGLGKVVLVAHLLTGARARGIELQPALVESARAAAARVGADVRFDCDDLRRADLSDGTVFFLYAPFTGPALAVVLDRLRDVALRRSIIVCALGIDLDRHAPWLARRRIDSFWLAVYDSVGSNVPPRRGRSSQLDARLADVIAFERDALND